MKPSAQIIKTPDGIINCFYVNDDGNLCLRKFDIRPDSITELGEPAVLTVGITIDDFSLSLDKDGKISYAFITSDEFTIDNNIGHIVLDMETEDEET